MPSITSLPAILAHARAGALDQAWRLFREAGLAAVEDNAAVLTVRGRLLKDRARASEGAARREFYARAAEAYGRAGALSGASYPLINAATLALLGGDAAGALERARDVLAALDADPDEAETPYWRGATRAEALLVLGEMAAARVALTEAVALAPRAWEDHAATLRQFALILEARGEDAGWLDALRPPRSLHFAGLMSLGADAAGLPGRIEDLLAAERIGFGHGALAAGADIVIAEALAARGAELHVVLPAPPAAFRAASVAPAGGDWAARFDALLAGAESVRVVGHSPAETLQPLAIRLAAEVAMGCAAMQARTLSTEAVQIVVIDPGDDRDGASARSLETWTGSGRRGHLVAVSRGGADAPPPETAPPARLAALLLVDLGDTPEAQLVDEILPRLGEIVGGDAAPLWRPGWDGRRISLAFADPAAAAALALRIAALAPDLQIGGHYGVVRIAKDPFGPGDLQVGEAAAIPAAILASTPPGAVHLSGDFAAALHAAVAALAPRTEYVGDLASDEADQVIGIFALVG